MSIRLVLAALFLSLGFGAAVPAADAPKRRSAGVC